MVPSKYISVQGGSVWEQYSTIKHQRSQCESLCKVYSSCITLLNRIIATKAHTHSHGINGTLNQVKLFEINIWNLGIQNLNYVNSMFICSWEQTEYPGLDGGGTISSYETKEKMFYGIYRQIHFSCQSV